MAGKTKSPETVSPPSTSPRSLAALVALGVVSALWALFLWGELLVARAGGEPFCAVSGAMNCAAVWDSSLASSIHAATGVPVAGWGLVWGLVALALPLWALADADDGRRTALRTAVRLTAAAGVVTVVALGGASIAMGHLCTGCLGTYVVVLAYGAVAWRGLPAGTADVPRALMFAGGATVAFFLVLLYPGLHTPKSMAKTGVGTLPAKGAVAATAPTPATNAPNPLVGGPGSGDTTRDEQLKAYLATLPPDVQQMTSNFLLGYLEAKPVEIPPSRVVIGDARAPIRVVDWTDPQCPHCAQLHETWKELAAQLPASTFRVEPRQFPLDGGCNANIQKKQDSGARCYAAKAQVCMEGHEKLFDFSGALFAAQEGITIDKVKAIAAPYMPANKLDACIASPDTQKKLDDDIAIAMQLGIQGTPLVIVNGREVTPFPPVLVALMMNNGGTQSPAYSVLPAPKAAADAHAGHAH